MSNNLISDLRPAGTTLFSGFDSFIRDLSEDDESVIAGGGKSRSNNGRGRRKRRQKGGSGRSRSNKSRT